MPSKRSSSIMLVFSALAAVVVSTAAFGQAAIVVDTRLLVAAHPLFKAYDPRSHRFKGTVSEPVPGGAKGLRELQEEVAQLEADLKNAAVELQKAVREAAPESRLAVEKRFLEDKKARERRLTIQKTRLYLAGIVPGRPGITPNNSIYPQVTQMLADIRNVVKGVQTRYRVPLVIDISGLCALERDDGTIPPLLALNRHYGFWQGHTSQPDANEWLRQAKDYWARKEFGAMVVPFGAVDARLESIQLLEGATGKKR